MSIPLIVILFSSVLLSVSGFNITNVVYQYILVCGFDRLCNSSNFEFLYRPEINYLQNSGNQLCPECSCDINCVTTQTCCPDLHFALPEVKCSDVTVTGFSSSASENGGHRYMVASCPNSAPKETVDLCTENSKPVQKLVSGGPVTGLYKAHINDIQENVNDVLLSYQNKYCAECNDVHSYSNWILDTECDVFADFNYLSTYEEVVELARERNCTILYKPDIDNTQRCVDASLLTDVFTSCNVTGHWKHHDADIEYACESNYYNRYRVFKNIFCFICNPSAVQTSTIINDCNGTGTWLPYDENLQIACQHYPNTHATFPFKNIFCYFCNKNNLLHNELTDAQLDVFENVYDSKEYRYQLFIQNFDTKKLDSLLVEKRKRFFGFPCTGLDLDCRSKMHLSSLNLTNLALYYQASRFGNPLCSSTEFSNISFFPEDQYCSCGVTCAFTDDKCCIDAAFEAPYACLADDAYSIRERKNSSKSFLVIDECPRQTADNYLTELCYTTNISSIYSLLPVQHNENGTVFKNIFCALCNYDIYNNLTNLAPILKEFSNFNLELHCTSYLYYSYFSSVYDVFKYARDSDCIVKIQTMSWKAVECSESEYFTERCNVTGFWPKVDSDILHACENIENGILPSFEHFKNIFCALCNPKNVSLDIIDSCNTTGLWDIYDPIVNESCKNYPESSITYPFRNRFCKLCNPLPLPVPEGIPDHSAVVITHTKYSGYDSILTPSVSFRSIFALSSYKRHQYAEEMKMNKTCSNNQIYDKKNGFCRNITCYPGKYLHGNECIPLFTVTNNLRYSLSFKLSADVEVNGIEIIHILQSAKKEFILRIFSKFGEVSFSSLYLLSNLPCSYKERLDNLTHFEIFVNTNFIIKKSVNRQDTEKYLNELTQEVFKLSIEGSAFNFASSPSQKAFYLPSLISKVHHVDQCHLYQHGNYSFLPHTEYRTSFVSNILLCRQIQLNKTEFTIDTGTTELHVPNFGLYFKYNEFEIAGSGKAIVCLTDDVTQILKGDKKPDIDEIQYILRLVTFISIIISLICLAIAFFTYCIFQTLRSVPGRNNMCLIFALFFSQLLLITNTGSKAIPELCIAVGMISHLFWLCTFLCMHVCSFHMYQVFAGSLLSGKSTRNYKTIIRYVSYSYGCPIAIVTLNAFVTSCVTNFQSTGYGNGKCFITSLISYIVTFLIPIILVCISNIYFFIVTGYKIRKSPRVESNQSDRREFMVYVKLFTITGITWIFQIIDSFFPASAFSIIAAILNGFQGLFIFLSYICNKRVFNLYKKLVMKKKASMSSTSNSTKLSNISMTSINLRSMKN